MKNAIIYKVFDSNASCFKYFAVDASTGKTMSTSHYLEEVEIDCEENGVYYELDTQQ